MYKAVINLTLDLVKEKFDGECLPLEADDLREVSNLDRHYLKVIEADSIEKLIEKIGEFVNARTNG
jgi:hypothetical protein